MVLQWADEKHVPIADALGQFLNFLVREAESGGADFTDDNLTLTCPVSAFDSQIVLIGAMICQDYVGDTHLVSARQLVRRLWITGGYSGAKLEAAVAESERRSIEQNGSRTLANQMPGTYTNADQILACGQLLADAQIGAKSAVVALE